VKHLRLHIIEPSMIRMVIITLEYICVTTSKEALLACHYIDAKKTMEITDSCLVLVRDNIALIHYHETTTRTRTRRSVDKPTDTRLAAHTETIYKCMIY
jgi:hypothetical protein